jgi:hypothetical protein
LCRSSCLPESLGSTRIWKGGRRRGRLFHSDAGDSRSSGLLAQIINLPDIVGAFLAGVAVNAAVHDRSAKVKLELKGEPDRDLRAVQRQLIKEVAVAEVIIIVPITNFGKNITGQLAA